MAHDEENEDKEVKPTTRPERPVERPSTTETETHGARQPGGEKRR